jgi:hypothetical protein
MTHVRTALLALSVVLSGCTSAPTAAIAPLEPLRQLEAELLVRPAERGLERPSFDPLSEAELADAEHVVSIRARFLAVDLDLAERALGMGDATLIAIVVTRERGERLLEELCSAPQGSELVNESKLELPAGQEGYVSVTRQRAFVSGFVLHTDGREALADPEVAVATQGAQLVATGTLGASAEHVTLDLRLDDCRLDDDFDELDVALAGVSVSIQQPRGLIRSLSTRVELARDEALLIGGSSLANPGDPRGLLVLVEAEALPVSATP